MRPSRWAAPRLDRGDVAAPDEQRGDHRAHDRQALRPPRTPSGSRRPGPRLLEGRRRVTVRERVGRGAGRDRRKDRQAEGTADLLRGLKSGRGRRPRRPSGRGDGGGTNVKPRPADITSSPGSTSAACRPPAPATAAAGRPRLSPSRSSRPSGRRAVRDHLLGEDRMIPAVSGRNASPASTGGRRGCPARTARRSRRRRTCRRRQRAWPRWRW